MTTDPQRDWPEDFQHEDGNYLNRCCFCHKTFTGNKDRTTCRKCVTSLQAPEPSKNAPQQPPERSKQGI